MGLHITSDGVGPTKALLDGVDIPQKLAKVSELESENTHLKSEIERAKPLMSFLPKQVRDVLEILGLISLMVFLFQVVRRIF